MPAQTRSYGHSRSRGFLLAVGALLLSLTALLASPSTYGTLTGTVNNTVDTAATAIFGSGRCTTIAAANGTDYFIYPFADAVSVAAAADVSGNNRPGTYTLNGVTPGAAGPCPRDAARAVTLNGSTGYISGPNTTLVNPTNFSIQIWFKTTVAGGKLIGFGNTRTGQSGQYDRHIYMQDDGKLTFGVYPGGVQTITSTVAYNDNQWHHVIATLSTSTTGTTAGIRLYVDGTLVASNAAITAAENFTGYWRIGYDNVNSWTNQPTNFFFTGSLAYAAYFQSVLTPAQVLALNNAGR